MEVNYFDSTAFKTWNYKFARNPQEMIVEAIAIMIGDYEITRKWAANLILKVLLRDDFKRFLFEDKNIYPVDRGDGRVLAWKKEVLSVGKCERCGSTEHLEAHHIIKWADYPKGRIDPKNGQCLCHNCHTEEHKHDQSYHMMKARFGKKM